MSSAKTCRGTAPWTVILISAFLITVAGCNTLSGQPAMRRAAITPDQLYPGAEAVLSVEIRDRQDIVKRVEGIILEDPRLTFRLRNDGQPPDAKAGDHTWSMAVVVPRQAVPGDYTMQITAIADDGRPILIRDKNGVVQPMQVTLPVRIQPAPENASPTRPSNAAQSQSSVPAVPSGK